MREREKERERERERERKKERKRERKRERKKERERKRVSGVSGVDFLVNGKTLVPAALLLYGRLEASEKAPTVK